MSSLYDILSVPGLKGVDMVSPAASLSDTGSLKRVKGYADSILTENSEGDSVTGSFDSLLQSAIDMVKETNEYSNKASEAELAYAMGLTNSTHDLQVAQMKAGISLQYTVAVRNAVMDAYKEIMQLQF